VRHRVRVTNLRASSPGRSISDRNCVHFNLFEAAANGKEACVRTWSLQGRRNIAGLGIFRTPLAAMAGDVNGCVTFPRRLLGVPPRYKTMTWT
jgi:hypothetical protein